MVFYMMMLSNIQYRIQYKQAILWLLNMTINENVQNGRLCVVEEVWARQQASLMGPINHLQCEQSCLKL